MPTTAPPPNPHRVPKHRPSDPDHRLDVRRRIPRTSLAGDLQRRQNHEQAKGRYARPDRRGAAASRRRAGAMRRPGKHRRHGPRHGLPRHRLARQGAGGQMHARPRLQSDRPGDRRPRPDRGRGLLADPPRSARGDRPFHPDRNLRDRHQGDRPADAVRPRRQGGPVRRGRLGQDRRA